MGIERPENGCAGHSGRRFEICDLTQGMDTAVRAAGTDQANPLSKNDPQGLLDFALDRALSRGLNLPAVKVGAVVFDGEFDISHKKCAPVPQGPGAPEVAWDAGALGSWGARVLFREFL